jgi:hypothetical protein
LSHSPHAIPPRAPARGILAKASDDWAVFRNNFEAFLMQNMDLPDTTIVIFYIAEKRKLKSDTFEDIAENGGLMLGMVNKSIPDSVLSGYYYHIGDKSDVDALYLVATTRLSSLNLAGKFLNSRNFQKSVRKKGMIFI